MIRILSLWAVVILALLAWVWFAAAPRAADCMTVDDLYAAAEEAGARITGAGVYDGVLTDMSVIVEEPAGIVLYGVKDGCIVAILVLGHRGKPKPTA